MADKLIVGWREWLALPVLGVPAIKAKVDTGARTSALHVFDLRTVQRSGRPWVAFQLHPLRRRLDLIIACEAELVDERLVRDSGGHQERRLVIETPIRLGESQWPVEITLTNREDMRFPMLLGRTAMAGRLAVDPECSFTTGRPPRSTYPRKKRSR
ncbi:MAG: RimK/LysX family protein [Candidatus Competibacteraceae bacterium]|nr:RimK/LysX family protein [Candidatus Competibacteraceae bacterium]